MCVHWVQWVDVAHFISEWPKLFCHSTPDFYAYTSSHALFLSSTRRAVCLFCACWLSLWWQPCPSVEEWAALRKSTGWWCPHCWCRWLSASTGPFSCHMHLRELYTSSLLTGVSGRENAWYRGTAVVRQEWFVVLSLLPFNLNLVLMWYVHVMWCMWCTSRCSCRNAVTNTLLFLFLKT